MAESDTGVVDTSLAGVEAGADVAAGWEGAALAPVAEAGGAERTAAVDGMGTSTSTAKTGPAPVSAPSAHATIPANLADGREGTPATRVR